VAYSCAVVDKKDHTTGAIQWQIKDFRTADYKLFAICVVAIYGPNWFCGLKTSVNPQMHNFSSYKYKLKMVSFKSDDAF
jgi:hypothetical protein